ncbi:MAG: hypothetical protein OEL88_02210 [Sterolibacteriaceae bacterium MAG5]|nr:hypothetical protein [Candidatus Nitricoxidireducens bremensis]
MTMSNHRSRRLILGKVPADFDFAVDIPAGPWCFLDHPADFDQWSTYAFVPDIRADLSHETSLTAFATCMEYRDRFFPLLRNRLNAENGLDYSESFWRELLDYWLITYIQILFVAQHTAQGLVDQYGDLDLTVELSPNCACEQFRDTEHFIEGTVDNLDFFVWAVSRFLEVIAPNRWCVGYEETHGPRMDSRSRMGDVRTWGRNWARRLWQRLLVLVAPRCIGVYSLSGWRLIVVSALLSLKPAISRVVLPRLTVPEGVRPAAKPVPLFGHLGDGRMMDIIYQGLPGSFRRIRSLPDLGWRIRPGKLRILGNRIVSSDSLKKSAALAREGGEFLIGCQHGSGYGDLDLPPTAIVEFALDAFITWGWAYHPRYACRYLPLSTPHLQKIVHRQASRDILFVGLLIPLFYPRIEGSYGKDIVIRYVRDKIRFLEALHTGLRGRVLYRPHLYPHTMNEIPYLQAHFPSLRILTRRPEEELAKCCMAVIDNPSTMFYQALSANVPTVAYWQRDLYQMHSRAATLYDDLRRAGILFEDAEAAAAHINAISANVSVWWQQPHVQEARARWCNEYALSRPDWFRTWTQSLWNFGRLSC